jgi:uncharacterized membrane protein
MGLALSIGLRLTLISTGKRSGLAKTYRLNLVSPVNESEISIRNLLL